jgi:predicted phosphohydrolase
MSLSIQIASDLHIECKNDQDIDPLEYITPKANILILAGDIGSLYKIQQLKNFLNKICDCFEFVLFIPGNHEYYYIDGNETLTFSALEQRLKNLSSEIPNLHILYRDSVLIGNICICGCTLWSNPSCPIPNFIVRIHEMTTTNYTKHHLQDLKFIKDMIKYTTAKNYKLVVVTHHPPTFKVLVDAKKRKKFISLYASNLDYLLDKDKVDTWICGHTHKNFDLLSEKRCRVLSNQKGKAKDYVMDYKKDFIIDL